MLTHRKRQKAFRVKLTDCQTDDEFIQLCCTGSRHTKAAYLQDIAYFQAIENRPLERVKIEDVAFSVKGWRSRGMRLVRFVAACMQLSLQLWAEGRLLAR